MLRRQAPRLVAAAICLLLISSRIHFDLVTQGVWPSYPYFFTAMTALLVARELEKATHLTSRIGWTALLAALIAASLMFASAGVAFLGAIVASTGVILLWNRGLALARLKAYLVVFLVGVAVEGLWLHQPSEGSAGIAATDWPVPGFPQSYLSQLKVKSGNYPELGMATPSDIPVRILRNASGYCNLLSRMLLRRLPPLAWMSIFVAGPLLLIILGWAYSVRPTGGCLQDWYFVGYGFIYLLWPWTPEVRFFLPVAPLAALYAWRGVEALVFLAKKKPRVLGIVWFPVAVLLAASAWLWMHGSGTASQFPNASLEDEFSFVIWLLSAILAAWMIWANTAWLTPASARIRSSFLRIGALRLSLARISQLCAMVVLAGLIIIGLTMQIQIGRTNLDPNSDTNRIPPDAEAGAWIRSHTDRDAVVMARLVPTVYHYSTRNVVWFPPSSNPQLLMEGILKHKINFVIVVRREYSYYLPADDDCFAPLLAAHPNTFRLVYQTPKFKIFQVVRNGASHLG